MKKYLAKQKEIEAIQLTLLNTSQIEAFVGGDGGFFDFEMVFATKEGALHASIGDWIIKSQGKFYSCKPDIFEMAYEAAE